MTPESSNAGDADANTSATTSAEISSVASKQSKSSKIAIGAVCAIVVIAVTVLIVRGLGDATVYFKTASEAVVERNELGEKRFRLEGKVVNGSISKEGEVTKFRLGDKGTEVEVSHAGQPLGIFEEGIPVVVEGNFVKESDVFSSDRIMVRHDNEYQADYPDRVSGQENQ